MKELFEIHWQHNCNGKRSNGVSYRVFNSKDNELSNTKQAECYAKSLSSGIYSVRCLNQINEVE